MAKTKIPAKTEQATSAPLPLAVAQSELAPFIFVEGVSSQGLRNGIAALTLEALRHVSDGNSIAIERVVVAHVRMPLVAIASLQTAIDAIRLMSAPTPSEISN